jgi:signal transduction histidine kinase
VADGSGATVRVVIEDEGSGVPASEREAIWQPFQRGSAAREGAGGSGIGLTVVKEIVEEHAGSVWVEDAAGGGAAFVVELPAETPVVDGRGGRADGTYARSTSA